MNPKGIAGGLPIAIIVVVIALGAVVLIATTPTIPPGPDVIPDSFVPSLSPKAPIPHFESCMAIQAAFEESQNTFDKYGYGFDMMRAISMPLAAPMAQEMATGAADGAGTQDYSQTNVQVEGVDEADIVKTDGEFIYTLTGDYDAKALTISKAFPASEAELVSYISLEDLQPQEMFIEDDFVLVFGQTWRNIFPTPLTENGSGVAYDEMYPYYNGEQTTILQLWNVSNKTNPELVKTVEVEGAYLSARKIGETAFFVSRAYPERVFMEEFSPDEIMPQYRETVGALSEADSFEPIARCRNIGYLPPIHAEAFITLGAFSMTNPNAELQTETVVGSGQNVYASLTNLYVSESHYIYPEIPPFPIVDEIARSIAQPTEFTIVHKFSLANSEVSYIGFMEAPGHILNQFSMDEFDTHFRIATTIGNVSRLGGGSTNNIYVFDAELERTGSLEDLAPGEQIYSARFMGKKGYLVTFKKIDPLFVIDLSDHSNPRVLGKLKIPGYSDYLHPFDETHIIGVGKHTIEAAEGDFAWYQGVKLAVFDVSDVENPKEMHQIIIGDRGTDSIALQDHKAFLFDREKELLILPITLAEIPEEIKESDVEQGNWPQYGEFTFQGAYVYNLSLANGFELKGRITHDETGEDILKSGYYYQSDNQVKRSLYIGNVLYTISNTKILLNDLFDLSELNQIELVPETA